MPKTTTVNSLVDICFNFTHSSFRTDEEDVLERAVNVGVNTMMVTGSDIDESARCIMLAERYPEYLYASAGVHPHLAKDWNISSLDILRDLAGHEKIVAIGETGLDYNRNFSPRDIQKRVFEQQVKLACELQLPLFLHCREAHEDFMEILRTYRGDLTHVVAHCFTGNANELEDYLGLDLHIGITGWICDERRGHHLHELIGKIPANRLMIETDAPYLLPRDLRAHPKARRNEPAFLPHILDTVAECLGKPAELVAQQTTQTAYDFYNL